MRKLRELFTDTLIYGISSVLARFVNYLLVPFHTGAFVPAQYTVVTLVYATIAFMNVLFTAGMESAYIRYAKDRDDASHVYKTLQLSLFGFATLLVLFFWLMEPLALPKLELDESTASIYLLMLGILWFDTLSIVPFAELRLVRRPLVYAAVRTGHVILNVFLNFYLILVLGWGIEAVFFSNYLASGIATLTVWTLTGSLLRGSWSPELLKKAVIFGWPFIPAGLGYATNEVLDRFFLNNMDAQRVTELYGSDMAADSIAGIYGACYKVAVFMLLLIQMFRMAWQPFFMRHADDPEAPSLFSRIFIYFNIAAAALYLTVGLFAREIVGIPIPFTDGTTLIDSSYWMGLNIVPLLLLAYWFHGWYMNFSAGIFISEKTGVLSSIMLIGAFITIVANALLVPLFGMMGSAWATVVSYGTMALLLWYFSNKAWPVPYKLHTGFIMMITTVVAVNLVPTLSRWAHLSEGTVKTVLFLAGILSLGFYTLNQYRADIKSESI